MERILVTLERDTIAYIRFIFEGYDGLGIVSTVDPYMAQVYIFYPACNRALTLKLIKALQNEGTIKEVSEA